jgi:NAD(P)-dependent dehydrogenase (short-subunit alcohol dehydrogenase family)
MKPLREQTILITGATDGIGKLAAWMLAKEGSRVLIHGRDKHKLANVIKEIESITGNKNLEGYLADFSSLAEVQKLAEQVLEEHSIIDLLINNAGAGYADPRYSKDGFELRFAVNYLAPFLLTHLLLPALKKAAPSRIVNVASAGQHKIKFEDIMMENKFDSVRAYSQSKLALIMFSMDMAVELEEYKISVNSLHPGTYLNTNMVRNAGIKPWGEAESGAAALVHLAISSNLEQITNKYFNVIKESRADPQAYDKDARKKLKEVTVELLNDYLKIKL